MTRMIAAVAGAGVLLAGLATGYVGWPARVSAREEPAAIFQTAKRLSIGVQVTRRGGDLEVQWDGASPLLRSGARGFVFITDGAQRTESYLEEAHLASGRLLYIPRSGDVDVRMEVITADDRVVRESVRVIAPVRIASLAAGTLRIGGVQVAAQPVSAAKAPDPAREFVAPAATRPLAAPSPDLAAPPSLAVQASLTTTQPPAPAAASLPPAPARAKADVQAPQIVRKAAVTLPPHLRAALQGDVDVRLALRIDEQGRVVAARPVEAPSGLKAQLAALAVSAARDYRFTAARLNGQAVASNHEVTFRFRR